MTHSAGNPRKLITVFTRSSLIMTPGRVRRILTIVMPITYGFLFMFGLVAAIYPIPTFTELVGADYGICWAILLAISALLSFIGLVFRKQLEIYSSIVLSILLLIYPFYIAFLVFHDPDNQDLSRLALVFATSVFPIMPTWRVFDIVIEIRKSKQRQMYTESTIGKA